MISSHVSKRFLTIIFFAVLVFAIGCDTNRVLKTALPTSVPPTLAHGVFTPKDMRVHVEQHPIQYKWILDADTAVLFAYPSPMIDWAASAFLIHIPSMSSVDFDAKGNVLRQRLNDVEGETRLTELLNNSTLMKQIQERIREIQKR